LSESARLDEGYRGGNRSAKLAKRRPRRIRVVGKEGREKAESGRRARPTSLSMPGRERKARENEVAGITAKCLMIWGPERAQGPQEGV
jgi:hypothetical protein